ncbi:MAG: hypothetical protein M3503_03805 [Actinomycetota bacterium]|nr:hypothetical protein [Actinomycetota bacterium]
MIWLVTRFVVVPVKAALGGVKLGYWTGRLVGYRRLAVLGTGVAIGLLVAPGPGAQLRERLRSKLEGGKAVPLTDSVPPRTPTPTVVVPDPVTTVAPTGAGATGSVPPAVMATAQETVDATLPAPVPVADVQVPSDDGPVADPVVVVVADAEGEALPAVPDGDPATIDPSTA